LNVILHTAELGTKHSSINNNILVDQGYYKAYFKSNYMQNEFAKFKN